MFSGEEAGRSGVENSNLIEISNAIVPRMLQIGKSFAIGGMLSAKEGNIASVSVSVSTVKGYPIGWKCRRKKL